MKKKQYKGHRKRKEGKRKGYSVYILAIYTGISVSINIFGRKFFLAHGTFNLCNYFSIISFLLYTHSILANEEN